MPLTKFSVTPTVSTTPAYSANDVIGGRLQFFGARRGRLYGVSVTDNAAQNVAYFLVLFDAIPTNITDNATFDIADADLDNIIRIEDLNTTYRTAFTDNSITIKDGLDVPLKSEETDGDLWAFLYSSGTPTYASTTDITVTLWIEIV